MSNHKIHIICIMLYVYMYMCKILCKSRELNLPWYLGKCLKTDTISPGIGTTIKLETFYLSVGIWHWIQGMPL